MKDFFISYNGKDKKKAEWIAHQLEAEGCSTIIQAWDFRPGSNIVLEMQKAIVNCGRTIVVLSQNFLDAEYTYPEWAAAFAQDPKGNARTLVPVRIDACQPEGLLAQIVYIDLLGKQKDAAQDALISGIKEGHEGDRHCFIHPPTTIKAKKGQALFYLDVAGRNLEGMKKKRIHRLKKGLK